VAVDNEKWNWRAASDAILALLAYDDCAHYLDLSSDKLEFIADLSEQPAPRLLLPAVRAFELIKNQGVPAYHVYTN
jgi:hypothetical protein